MNVAGVFNKVAAFGRSATVAGIMRVFALKGSVVVLNFSLLSLAARDLGAHDFGMFSILFSAAGLLSVFATSGQQILLIRTWNEFSAKNDLARLKGALEFSALMLLVGGIAFSAAFYFGLRFFFEHDLASAVTLYMFLLAVSLTSMHLVRTAISVGMGDGVGNMLAVIPPLIYLLVCFSGGNEAHLTTIFLMYALGCSLAITVQLVAMLRKIKNLFPGFWLVTAQFEWPQWLSRSLKLWMSNGLESANQYLDVLIIGYLMTPSIAGAYFVTTRLANAFAVAAGAMNMFSTRHIPDYYYRKEYDKLSNLLDSVAKVTLAIILMGMIFILGTGPWLLLMFNEAYVPYYPALALLCFGTAAVTSVGSSASILMLTGHEGATLTITATGVAIRALAFFILVPSFQVMGAVIATTGSFFYMAIMLRNAAKHYTGIDGSITRLMPGASPDVVKSVS